MKRFGHIILTACVVISAASCSDYRTGKKIQQAEELIMSRPDSSLAIINSIDGEKINSKALKARYSLYRTMAIDRNRVNSPDLSPLLPAIDYYANHGPLEEKVRTLFYQGRIQLNGLDYASATVSLLRAFDLAQKLDDNWLKGMICTDLSIIHNNNYDREDEVRYCNLAYDYFSANGDRKYVDFARNSLALAYHNNRKFDASDSLLLLMPTDHQAYPMSVLTMAMNESMRPVHDAHKACGLYEEAIRRKAELLPENWWQFAFVLAQDGQKARSDSIVRQLESVPLNAKSMWWKYQISKANGNPPMALEYLEAYVFKENELVHNLLEQSVYKTESTLFSLQKEESERQNANLRLTVIIIILVFFALSLAAVLIFVAKKNKVQRERYELMLKIAEAQRLLECARMEEGKQDRYNTLQAAFASIYKNQFRRIGDLYHKNLDLSSMADAALEQYASLIKDILSEISHRESSLRFESRLDKDLDGIMTKLRGDFPSFKEDTFQLLSYVVAGFKDSTVAALMNMNPGAVRTKKSRIRNTILNSDSPNLMLYKAFL